MIAKNQTFNGVNIVLDGSSFYDCTFENCTIIFSATLPFTLQNPKFTDCKWEMVGPADQTLKYLAALYQAGAQELVEATFDNIRGKPQPGQTVQ